jgi:hypothetical protein
MASQHVLKGCSIVCNSGWWSEYDTSLRQNLVVQKDDLAVFLSAFSNLSTELNIINPKSFRKLYAFVYPKCGLIDVLSAVIHDDCSEAALFFLNENSREKLARPNEEPGSDARHARHDFTELKRTNEHQAISDLQHIQASKVDVLRAYLEQRKPLEQLNELEEVLEKLHHALTSNFDLGDILLAVGDDRLRNSSLPHWTIHRKRFV